MDAATLQAEAERQARQGMRPGPLKTECVTCSKPFKFGEKTAEGVNVYSMAGARDTQIIEMCEACFDALDMDDDEGSDEGSDDEHAF